MASLAATAPAQRQNARWIGRREIIAMIVGSLLYCGILWFTSFAKLGSGFGVELRPGIVVPIVFGFVYGPLVGFVVGTVGNTMSDYQLWHDVWWQWSVGNGIMGLIPGLYALRWRSYRSLREQVIAFIVAAIGIIAGMAFASFSSIAICQPGIAPSQCFKVPTTVDDAMNAFVPAVRVNIINAIVLVPLLLFNIERLDIRGTNWSESGLLRRLLLVIVVSAALPIALLGFFLTQQFSGQTAASAEAANDVMIKLLSTILISLLFTITNAALAAQSISRPLLRLTGAAHLMERGKLSGEQAEDLKSTVGNDEISQLSRMFGNMAREVIQREESLRKQVEELRIEIDLAKQQKQVAEITENDYFRELQAKAQRIRNRQPESAASEQTNAQPDAQPDSQPQTISPSPATGD